MEIEKDEVDFFESYIIVCLGKQKTTEKLLISRREFTKRRIKSIYPSNIKLTTSQKI